MKTLNFLIFVGLIPIFIIGFNEAHAQYGNESSNPSHQRTLQEQLDLARTHIEMKQQEDQQAKNISDAIILAEVGIPIAIGISAGVLLFTRKRN